MTLRGLGSLTAVECPEAAIGAGTEGTCSPLRSRLASAQPQAFGKPPVAPWLPPNMVLRRGCALPPPGKAGLSDAGCLEKPELCERAAVARQRLAAAAEAELDVDVEDAEAPV